MGQDEKGSGEGEGGEVGKELPRSLAVFGKSKQQSGNWVKGSTLGHAGEQLRPDQPS